MDISIGGLFLFIAFGFLTLVASFLFLVMSMGMVSREGPPWDVRIVDKLVLYPFIGLLLSLFPAWLAKGYPLLSWVFGSTAPWLGAETVPLIAFWGVASVIGGFWMASIRSGRKGIAIEHALFFLVQTAWFAFAFPMLTQTLS